MKTLAAAVLLAAGAAAARAQEAPTGSWPESGRFPTGSGFFQGGSAGDGSYLYLLGGGQNPFEFRRYDPAGNVWISLPQMPQPNVNFDAVYCNGSVYSVGNGWQGAGWIFRFDLASGSWTGPVATLSNGRFHCTAAASGTKIYAAGGISNFGGFTDEFESYDTETGQLTALDRMPQPQRLAVGVSVPSTGRAYFIGGQGPQGFLSECFEYDPEQGDWTVRAPMTVNGQPHQSFFGGGFVLRNRIYVAGGNTNVESFSTVVLEYSPAGDEWVRRANLAVGRFGHGAEAANGHGFVYGGQTNSRTDWREEFIPPDFGKPPVQPDNVIQVGEHPLSSEQGGWTNDSISFQADLHDPDAGQQVRLEVQVRAIGDSSWGAVLSSGNQPQGAVSVSFAIPDGGAFDWRWRVADAFDNYALEVDGQPQWTEAFGNPASPDFRSDQVAPAQPIALSPDNADISVFASDAGPVTLHWVEATDNGPQTAITYEIQVGRDGAFNNVESAIESTGGHSSHEVILSVARTPKYWRLRARDIGGNVSTWSNVRTFRVVFDDREDHASGDADKYCGFGAAAAGVSWTALAGLALLGAALLRRRF